MLNIRSSVWQTDEARLLHQQFHRLTVSVQQSTHCPAIYFSASATIGIIAFFATLLMAPSIANGILLGVVLTVLHLLVRIMKSRCEIVGRRADGTLGGMMAHARAILVIGSGVNEIDASGEEKAREIAERLCEEGVELIFSGLKHQVKSVLEQCGIVDSLGENAF